MPRIPSFLDLVHDAKLETFVTQDYTEHVIYQPGESATERLVRRRERWTRNHAAPPLGQGAYGIVYREMCQGQDRAQRLRAVKEIRKQVAGEDLDYMRELEAIFKFSHPRYAHCFVRSDGWFENSDMICISMEFIENGDLQRYLDRPFPESEARQIVCQVCEGLEYMHDNEFVHRDLKPGNIMVVSPGPQWFVKISDFGISKRRQQGVTSLHTMQRGTMGFAAPEALEIDTGKPESSCTFAVDMWSLGAVTYYILSNRLPFEGPMDLCKYVMSMKPLSMSGFDNDKVSNNAQEFIRHLLSPIPASRLTAKAASMHEWIGLSADSGSRSMTQETLIPPAAEQLAHSIASNNTLASVPSAAWTTQESAAQRPASGSRTIVSSHQFATKISKQRTGFESQDHSTITPDKRKGSEFPDFTSAEPLETATENSRTGKQITSDRTVVTEGPKEKEEVISSNSHQDMAQVIDYKQNESSRMHFIGGPQTQHTPVSAPFLVPPTDPDPGASKKVITGMCVLCCEELPLYCLVPSPNCGNPICCVCLYLCNRYKKDYQGGMRCCSDESDRTFALLALEKILPEQIEAQRYLVPWAMDTTLIRCSSSHCGVWLKRKIRTRNSSFLYCFRCRVEICSSCGNIEHGRSWCIPEDLESAQSRQIVVDLPQGRKYTHPLLMLAELRARKRDVGESRHSPPGNQAEDTTQLEPRTRSNDRPGPDKYYWRSDTDEAEHSPADSIELARLRQARKRSKSYYVVRSKTIKAKDDDDFPFFRDADSYSEGSWGEADQSYFDSHHYVESRRQRDTPINAARPRRRPGTTRIMPVPMFTYYETEAVPVRSGNTGRERYIVQTPPPPPGFHQDTHPVRYPYAAPNMR